MTQMEILLSIMSVAMAGLVSALAAGNVLVAIAQRGKPNDQLRKIVRAASHVTWVFLLSDTPAPKQRRGLYR
jgi:hypothetical protein